MAGNKFIVYLHIYLLHSYKKHFESVSLYEYPYRIAQCICLTDNHFEFVLHIWSALVYSLVCLYILYYIVGLYLSGVITISRRIHFTWKKYMNAWDECMKLCFYFYFHFYYAFVIKCHMAVVRSLWYCLYALNVHTHTRPVEYWIILWWPLNLMMQFVCAIFLILFLCSILSIFATEHICVLFIFIYIKYPNVAHILGDFINELYIYLCMIEINSSCFFCYFACNSN